MNKPPLLNRDCNRDPNIQALKRRGFINHGSAFCIWGCVVCGCKNDICLPPGIGTEAWGASLSQIRG